MDVFGLKQSVRPPHMNVPNGKVSTRLEERQILIAAAVGIVTSLVTFSPLKPSSIWQATMDTITTN